MKICNKCEQQRELKYFYCKRDKHGREKYINICKWCLGVKNPDKKLKFKTEDKKPSKKEMMDFIDEMNYKSGYFDFVDCLRLVDIFTRQNGIVHTTLSTEHELMYMWEELKHKMRKK
jgi:hypothetical protein